MPRAAFLRETLRATSCRRQPFAVDVAPLWAAAAARCSLDVRKRRRELARINLRTYPSMLAMTQTLRPDRLRTFVGQIAALVDGDTPEAALLDAGATALRELIAHDDWLPDAFARPDPERYQQYLLHADSRQRFSVVSFVWGPGQATPVHDHTVWGLIGVLRGAEIAQRYRVAAHGEVVAEGAPERLGAGAVDAVSPRIGDIHRVSNAFSDRTSISIHVYGGNIGAVNRSVYPGGARRKKFVSGYSNDVLPNIWNVSKESPIP
jgi:predicted metal-dependent enzyme (double-stranded beta helix superfamily)